MIEKGKLGEICFNKKDRVNFYRYLALSRLQQLLEEWDYGQQDDYNFMDLKLDQFLRHYLQIKEREHGNYPYEDWLNENKLE